MFLVRVCGHRADGLPSCKHLLPGIQQDTAPVSVTRNSQVLKGDIDYFKIIGFLCKIGTSV